MLHEWGHTIASLPLILQTAVQMGLISSAQLARFCAMDNRPNVTRWIARHLPIGVSCGRRVQRCLLSCIYDCGQ